VSIAYHIVSIAHDGIHLRGSLPGKIPALRGRQVSGRAACHHRLSSTGNRDCKSGWCRPRVVPTADRRRWTGHWCRPRW